MFRLLHQHLPPLFTLSPLARLSSGAKQFLLTRKKEKKNIDFLNPGLCFLCQIRRYMYYDVLRLGDAETVLNCSLVQVRKSQNVIKHSIDIVILTLSEFMMTKQPYTTNKTKVVFLKQRPHTRSHRGSSNLCITCDRNLQDPYIFCSLSCKVQFLCYSNKLQNSSLHFSYFDANWVVLIWTRDHCSRCSNIFY